MTRSKKVSEESFATTLAILKNVRTSSNNSASSADAAPGAPADDAKENKKQEPAAAPAPTPAPPDTRRSPKAESRYHLFPRGPTSLPCAQYKTEKGYRCPNCQRCYNARKNLVRHVTLECGREPQYKCPHCSYSKHRRNELKKHIEKKHPEHAPPRTPPHAPAHAAPLAL